MHAAVRNELVLRSLAPLRTIDWDGYTQTARTGTTSHPPHQVCASPPPATCETGTASHPLGASP